MEPPDFWNREVRMSYETKAGVAVSFSFLCLVGVVLSSKLWEGQPANAGSPSGQENAESVGANAQPGANTVAPESKVPNLKTPPAGEPGLQQVAGTGNGKPQFSIENLFKNDDDPFQGKPQSDATGGKQSTGGSESPPPGFKSQQGAGMPVVKQPDTPADPKVAAGATSIKDPKQAVVPTFEEMANQFKKQAAAAGTSAGNSAASAGQSAVKAADTAAATATQGANAAGKSLDDMVLEAEKKAKEMAAAQNPAPDVQKSGPANSDDVLKELKIQTGKTQGTSSGADPIKTATRAVNANVAATTQQMNNGAGTLADQAKNSFDALNNYIKKTAGGADAALSSGQQQLNQGAAALTNGAAATQGAAAAGANEILNAGKGAVAAGGAAAGAGLAAAAGTNQPRFPTNSVESNAGQTDAGGSGSRAISPVSLGPPTSPPDNQYAQLRNEQPAPAFQPPPAYGARPEASVQPMTVPVPLKSAPVQKDSWDDDLYVARTGDTYQTIARNYYKSEKYGQALMLYNRDYDGQATEASKRDPAAIAPGQKIYVPPERILKRDYGSVILDQPATSAATPSSPTPVAAATLGATTSTLPEKSYRVRGGGAMFLTIARSTLGNDERWPEIYRLNPSFDPTKFIPGGTVLRMPGDAKIDPADAP
jgi:hypothetical protein